MGEKEQERQAGEANYCGLFSERGQACKCGEESEKGSKPKNGTSNDVTKILKKFDDSLTELTEVRGEMKEHISRMIAVLTNINNKELREES